MSGSPLRVNAWLRQLWGLAPWRIFFTHREQRRLFGKPSLLRLRRASMMSQKPGPPPTLSTGLRSDLVNYAVPTAVAAVEGGAVDVA